MTLRIVVTGPECTGKTTLAARLAEAIGAPWVAEASRAYAERAAREGRTLTAADVEPIAGAQIAAEDAVLAAAPPVVVLDTDLLSTIAYAAHYYGRDVAWINAAARERRGDLYLLCAPDIPWVPDGIRDRPDAREELLALFRRVLCRFDANVAEVRGLGAARLDAALHAVRPLLAEARP
jgi:NadR type nicotinamide-nucleotide adenylyltransferase